MWSCNYFLIKFEVKEEDCSLSDFPSGTLHSKTVSVYKASFSMNRKFNL